MRISLPLLLLGAGSALLLGSCRPRPTTVPLGGAREVEAEVRAPAGATPSALPAVAVSVPAAGDAAEEDAAGAEVVEVSARPTVEVPTTSAPQVAASSAFQVKPYAARQAWNRVVDVDVALKVGPTGNLDMKMVTHQEARFEVVSVSAGVVEKLAIQYSVYTTKLSFMGSTQDSSEELAGKRFIVTFNGGKPDVRDPSGAVPPKKQVDSVKDDAREPLEMEKALKELASLTAQGRGDFSAAGATALAGGEDEDTKVTRARGALERVVTGPQGGKQALLDLGYTLSSKLDDTTTLEATVTGSLTIADAPPRYQTSTLQGPMELRSSDPSGMAGRGTIKVVTSYRY